MRVVFMGTPQFALNTLIELDKHHEVVAVFTQPDKPRDRGKKIQMSPVKEWALQKEIKVYQPISIRKELDFVCKEITDLNIDTIIVVAFGQLIPKQVLDLPKYGCINVHGSLLPKYRGAAPIQWAILDGEEKTGVTIMYMDETLDTGDMILKAELPISQNDNYESIYEKMSHLGGVTLVEALKTIGTKCEKQNDAESTYARMIKKEDGKIDFNLNSIEIFNRVRALNPWPSTYCKYNDKSLKIFHCEVVEYNSEDEPGKILSVSNEILVKTKDGAIRILELQIEGGKRVKTLDFLNGRKLEGFLN